MGFLAVLVWIISLLVAMALLFLAVFSVCLSFTAQIPLSAISHFFACNAFVFAPQLVSYSDLDVDLNPIDLAKRLNPLMMPEMIAFFVITALFLFGGFWIEFAFCVPLAAWYGYTIYTKSYRIDATQVFARLSFSKNVALAKLVYFMLFFFLCLYRMVYYLVVDYM